MPGPENSEQQTQDPSVVSVCHLCGKVKRQGRKGTMTAWIFGGSLCTCDSAGSFTPLPFPLETPSNQPKVQLPDLSPTYTALSFIGEGGMGSVWKARENSSGRLFAIKILRKDLAQDPGSVKRFEQEVRAASELTHPNLVFVHGSDRMADGTPYMVMRYIEGIDLSEIVTDEIALPFFRVMPIFTQAAEALQHAHNQGVIHRDLKPSNIIVSRNEDGSEHIRIVDFGIAKIISSEKSSELTQTGEVFGSPLYMSPEQCDGLKIDVTSDIYSLGCVVYFMVCGQPPFNDRTPLKIMMNHLQAKPKPLNAVRPEMFIPKELNTIVMKCLEKNPSHRYQTMQALLRDIAIVSSKYPARASMQANSAAVTGLHKSITRRRQMIAVVAGTVMLTGATVLLLYSTLHMFRAANKQTSPTNLTVPTKVDRVPAQVVSNRKVDAATDQATEKLPVSKDLPKEVRAEAGERAETGGITGDTKITSSKQNGEPGQSAKIATTVPALAKVETIPQKAAHGSKEYITYCMTGQRKEHQGDIAGAIKDFKASLQANPMKDLVHGTETERSYKAITIQHLGYICCMQGRYKEGIDWLSQAITLRPTYPDNYKNRGLAYLKIGDYVRSQDDYATAHEYTIHPQPDDISNAPETFAE